MTVEEWPRAAQVLAAYWPHARVTAAMQEVWSNELADESLDAVLRALRRLRDEEPTWAPTLGKVLQMLSRPEPREPAPPQRPIGDEARPAESHPWTSHRAMVHELNTRRNSRGNKLKWTNRDGNGRMHSGYYTLPTWHATDCVGVMRWQEVGHPSMVLAICDACSEEATIPRSAVMA